VNRGERATEPTADDTDMAFTHGRTIAKARTHEWDRPPSRPPPNREL
jgi:hypothetical protein